MRFSNVYPTMPGHGHLSRRSARSENWALGVAGGRYHDKGTPSRREDFFPERGGATRATTGTWIQRRLREQMDAVLTETPGLGIDDHAQKNRPRFRGQRDQVAVWVLGWKTALPAELDQASRNGAGGVLTGTGTNLLARAPI